MITNRLLRGIASAFLLFVAHTAIAGGSAVRIQSVDVDTIGGVLVISGSGFMDADPAKAVTPHVTLGGVVLAVTGATATEVDVTLPAGNGEFQLLVERLAPGKIPTNNPRSA